MVCTPNSPSTPQPPPPIPHPPPPTSHLPPTMSHADFKCLYFHKKKSYYYYLLRQPENCCGDSGFKSQEERKKYICAIFKRAFSGMLRSVPKKELFIWPIISCLPPSLLKQYYKTREGGKQNLNYLAACSAGRQIISSWLNTF